MNCYKNRQSLILVAALAASLSACATGPRIPVCADVAKQPDFVSKPGMQPTE